MNKFNDRYLQLLRRQVEEEIQYLIDHKHHTAIVDVPCMFCAPRFEGGHVCHRIGELKRFLGSILSHIQPKIVTPKAYKPTERKAIGYEPDSFPIPETGTVRAKISDLPLLSIKL